MVKLNKLPGTEIISGLKGVIDFYLWMGIPVARSWPNSPGHDRAPRVEAQWPRFAFSGLYWSHLSPAVQQAYNDMASGYPVSGRDLFTQTYISGVTIRIE